MIELADVRGLELFAGVSDEQLGRLVSASDEVTFAPGDVLFVEGEPADWWWVLVAGEVELTRGAAGQTTVVGKFDAPGRWAGGFRAWDDAGLYLASGHATSAGRMMRVPASALHELFEGYPLASRLIEGLFHTARNVEATTRQRDALEALGRLSARLAHELNNPIAAATRAVDSLASESDALLTSLRQLADCELTAAQFAGLDELRSQLHAPIGAPDERALAAAEEELVEWLEEHDVEKSWVLAPVLAAGGADVDWCGRVAALVPGRAHSPAFVWVAAVVAMSSLLAQVKEATRRVSALVADTKSYTQMDRAPMQRVDLTDGLESTLRMLGQLDGITIVRDYSSDVPEIDVFASELNQVWTNLIANAVHAMDGNGTLRLSTAVDGDRVLVEIADTGVGIPADVVGKVFDPFFTTKGVGGGTGLGLDISRRIVVDRHGGTITVESEPGNTVFRVSLPCT